MKILNEKTEGFYTTSAARWKYNREKMVAWLLDDSQVRLNEVKHYFMQAGISEANLELTWAKGAERPILLLKNLDSIDLNAIAPYRKGANNGGDLSSKRLSS